MVEGHRNAAARGRCGTAGDSGLQQQRPPSSEGDRSSQGSVGQLALGDRVAPEPTDIETAGAKPITIEGDWLSCRGGLDLADGTKM